MIAKNTDILDKLSSLKSALDGYRPFSEHVVRHKAIIEFFCPYVIN